MERSEAESEQGTREKEMRDTRSTYLLERGGREENKQMRGKEKEMRDARSTRRRDGMQRGEHANGKRGKGGKGK